jgi:uncharacterized protein (DUF302 family)
MKQWLILGVLGCLSLSAESAESASVIFKSQGRFEEVRALLQSAIEGKGLKINHTNKIAAMLDRTGKDMGETSNPVIEGEQFEFCNATLSRQMMATDPHTIVLCPYGISVYMLPGDKTVYLAYRKMPATRNPGLRKTFKAIERLLADIIQEAL